MGIYPTQMESMGMNGRPPTVTVQNSSGSTKIWRIFCYFLRKEDQKLLNVGNSDFPINSRMIEKTLQVCGPEMEQKGNMADANCRSRPVAPP
jgi:hypothetical protein